MAFRNKRGGEGRGAALRKVAFFEGFSDPDLDRVAELAEEVWAEPGAVLMDQGKPGTECFVIVDGEVGVFKGLQKVATLKAGDMVGEMALIGHGPRNATVTAMTPTQLLSFDTDKFRTLLDEMPQAAEQVDGLLKARAASEPAD
jgi:CRP-like cAMP-binding protein